MGPESVTSLTFEHFEGKVNSKKLILLYPWTTYRTTFLSYMLDSGEDLIYYRLTNQCNTLKSWLETMSQYLSEQLESMPDGLKSELDKSNPSAWGHALAEDLNTYANGRAPFYVFFDEIDRIPHNDSFAQFFEAVVDALADGIHLVISSRFLKYQPWYDLVANGAATVLGTERRVNDAIYTLTDTPKPSLEVYALGRGHALANGLEISNWDGALPRNLFFYFIDNLLVTRRQIFDIFWPNLSTKEATNVFHVTKRKISERITMKVDTSGNYELTQYGSGFYTPSTKIIRYYDVHSFEDAVNTAMTTVDDHEEELLLGRAIDLYKGPFLKDGKMQWMQDRRNELRQLYAQALIGMGRLSNREGDERSALGFFSRALKETPEREDIHREIMVIYLNQDMIDDAKGQYRILENILDTTLNIGPSRESRELFDLIETRA